MADGGATHTVGLEITAEDHASGAVEKVGHALEHAGEAGHGLHERFHELTHSGMALAVGIAGVGFGLHEMADKAIEGAKELSGMKKDIAGVNFAFEGWKKGIPNVERMKIALEEGAESAKEFEEQSGRLAIGGQTLTFIYQKLAAPGFNKLGMSREQVMGLTVQTAELAKVTRTSGEAAAMAMGRLLQFGQLPKRAMDPVSNKLSELVGKTKHLSSAQLYDRIKSQLKDLGPAAELMSKGLDGSLFRIQKFFSETLRDAATPAITFVASKLEQWTHALEESVGHGRKLADVIGDKILTVFKAIASTVEFIADHWKALALAMAAMKAPAAFEAITSAAKAMKGLGVGASGVVSQGMAGGAKGMLGRIGQLSMVAGTVYLAGNAIAEYATDKYIERGDKQTQGMGLEIIASALEMRTAKEHRVETGVMDLEARQKLREEIEHLDEKLGNMATTAGVGTGGKANLENVMERLNLLEAPNLQATALKLGLDSTASIDKIGETLATVLGNILGDRKEGGKDEDAHVRKAPQANFGDIYITQDFKDQDPDRVFVAMKNELESYADKRMMPTSGFNPHSE